MQGHASPSGICLFYEAAAVVAAVAATVVVVAEVKGRVVGVTE